MNTQDLYNLFRSQVKDDITPFLWSDPEVYDYMNDAHFMFCRLVRGIADSTTPTDTNGLPLTLIPVNANDIFEPISPLILKIREAQRDYDNNTLTILNFEDITSGHYLATPQQDTDYGFVNRPYKLDSVPGVTSAIIEGMEQEKIRLLPPSDRGFNIELIIYRLPLETITAAAAPQNFEIDVQHHRHLLLWMKYLAYSKEDAETFNKSKALENKALFEEYCDRAKLEKDTREAKYRQIAYGGL